MSIIFPLAAIEGQTLALTLTTIGLIVTTAGGIASLWITQRYEFRKLELARQQEKDAREEERAADFKRQDAVAAQAAQAAKLLLAANERVAKTTHTTNQKLQVIHTLVNSNLTTAKQERLDGMRRELVLLRELMRRDTADGNQPSTQALAEVEAMTAKIAELEVELADRLEQQKLAELQAKTMGQAPPIDPVAPPADPAGKDEV